MKLEDMRTVSHPLRSRKHRYPSLSKPATIILLGVCFATILILTPIILLTSVKTQAPSPTPSTMIHPTSTPTATPSPSPTAIPVPSTPPTLSPISPFPTTLTQQQAVMLAKDRFFFHGNTRLPEIALTFDDGPNPPYTSQILAILRHYGVKATFFCVGKWVQRYPELVRQEYDEGHTIGNHTWGHPYMPSLSAPSIIWQLTTAGDVIQRTIGVRPTFFRPPYGAINSNVLTYANRFTLTVIQWNVDPRDWSMPGVNAIYIRVLTQVRAGSIILMHDGGGNRSETVMALPIIIEWLQRQNFQFVTIPRLVHDAQLAHS